MNRSHLGSLFARHVPSALREAEHPGFDDEVQLNIAHRLIDEFWSECRHTFVRSGTHRLVLEHDALLREGHGPSVDQLLRGFLACEVELRIEPRMTIEQRETLATAFQNIGEHFMEERWFAHARFCFSRSANLFADLRLHRRGDDSWYLESLAAMKQSKRWVRLRQWPVWWFAGFGYRPYRMFNLGAMTVLIFGALYALLEPWRGWFDAVFFSATNYLALLGYGDAEKSSSTVKVIIVFQGFISLAVNTTLFALLVRRWFRA